MRVGKIVLGVSLAVALPGCMSSPPPVLDKIKSFAPGKSDTAPEVTRETSSFTQVDGDQSSELIDTLLARGSLLQPGSPYKIVADAAVAASARSSEAELRAAKLRAEAQSKNWLPTIGPSVSLSSLGDLVASLLIEQVLWDNGRRKAERAFAAADVEVAAVNLSIDMNTRVENAVGLYVTALRAEEKTELTKRALARMYEFDRVVRGRVSGGVSDRADLRVVEGKISELEAARATAEEAGRAARAELLAMTGREFELTPANLSLDKPPVGLRHLSVLLATAEGNRSVAQTKIDRAGLLPQLTASANVSNSGTNAGIGAASPALGLGTPAAMKALKISEEAATRGIGEAEEEARRRESRQMQRLASFQRQEAEALRLARGDRETYRLFERQFKEGQRSVMDVVSIYEKLVSQEQSHLDAKFEVMLIQLEMARDRGLLADGDAI